MAEEITETTIRRFPSGTNREVTPDLPTLVTVQEITTGLVTAVCVDFATAEWWVTHHGKAGVGYEKIGHTLTVMGIPSTITVRRMEVSRDGTPRVI
jgi:hypothetical protein